MININAFHKNHPHGAQNRACVRSAELLKRIDKALAAKEIPAKEQEEIEGLLRQPALVFPAPYLLNDLYDTNGVTIKVAEPTQPVEPAKPTKTPVIDNDNDKGTGEPGLGIEDPTLNPGVGHPADEGTGEPSGEPAPEPIEPAGEGIPDGEPMNTNGEIVDNNEETTTPSETETPSEEPVNEEKVEEPAPADMEPANEETTDEPAPAEDTTEAPAETEQPKAKRGRKKADAAE